jgi:hypothetical protein
MDADIVTHQGRRYRLWQGRVLLDWAKRPMLRHRAGCVLCCDVRITGGPGSPPRHPPACSNCMTYRGPRPDPCRFCGRTAHFLDDDGRPVHKACLEQAITADLSGEPDADRADRFAA